MKFKMKFSGHIPILWKSALLLATASTSAQQPAANQPVLREIVDPHSGVHWLLVRDAAHPGGPGRLLELPPDSALETTVPPALPVIRIGDRVRVEEHTSIADAVLDSVALGTAGPGAPLRVRLKIGGRIVQAVALAPGRAALILGLEVQR